MDGLCMVCVWSNRRGNGWMVCVWFVYEVTDGGMDGWFVYGLCMG